MIKSNNIYQIINNSSNDQMLTNITNQACDRFIPNRNNFKLDLPQNTHPENLGHPSANYSFLISKRLFNNKENCKAFNLPQQLEECKSQLSTQSCHSSKLKPNVSSPVKILDIPHFKDDFYLNNIDWSQAGPLGIALNKEIFLYTPENITQMGRNTFKQQVSGIKINQKLMAVGCMDGSIEIYDLERCIVVRTLIKHQSRVAALMFMDDFLVSGSKDKTIVVHDLRQRYHCIKEYFDHKGQICTLKAKNKNQKIFASGSVDGSAIIWDLNYGFIDQLKGHKGAVKALDWCPWKSGILATGGGNQKNKSIKLWNTNNSKLILQQSIQSQISGIVWNQQLKMMITSHGFPKNQLNFWNLNTNENNSHWRLQKKKSFQAHSRRVLNIFQSGDSSYLCTVGGDQTLKLWSVNDSKTNPFFTQTQSKRKENYFRI